MVIAPLLQIVLYAFLVLLLIRAVFSWIEPYPKNRVHVFAFKLTEPILAPVRRLVPPIGGFDIAFLLVFIGVSMVIQLVQRTGF
jgi:YggT family protein